MAKCNCGFCHLHVHSEYSLLDGASRIKDLAKRAAAMDMPALALTDHGAMYGAIDHYQACLAEGIKPIIGVETYVASRKHTDKDARLDNQKSTHHLTLWAKNQTGYKNLVKLITRAHLDGFYYRPRVDHELLAQYSEGLICGSACLGGEIPQLIVGQKLTEATARAEKYREIFGPENFFLELMDHDLHGQDEVNQRVIDIHHKTGAPLIVTNDAHYLRAEDERMHKVLVCIGTNSTLDNSSLHYGPHFYLKSPDEMYERFRHVPEALENTLRIADMVNLELDLKTTHFPNFEVPPGHDLVSYLRELCKQRFPLRYPAGHQRHDEATKRMEYELGIIIQKGYAGYFLVVQDFINWSKERGILVGCRGSAAGCLVSYVLGITNLDPLPYGLLFERFLNPDRVSTPDIDVDFPDKRRDEVLQYVSQKYGKEKVAQIITFGTLAARAAVRDTARAMGLDLKIADNVAKLIPAIPGHAVSIKQAIEQVKELGDLYTSDSSVRELCDTAQQIEGLTRHASRHACGVVIGQGPLDDLVPLEEKDGDIITQYHAKALEKIGLVKMDFLGLQSNTVINDAVELIKQRRGVELDLENIDLNDKKVYDMLSRGDGIAVFQMEGTGMRNLLRELQPQNLEHIIAQISLYRPGPMEEIPRYVKGRHGGKVTYPHPKLKPILEDTYGMLLYQEQVMQASQVLAGFTGGQAETLMKAMSKKKADDMAKLKPLFLEGCERGGTNRADAEEIFDRMEAFAKYAFNKSHAAYYGLVAYWTAYLKVNFPQEYMSCRLTSLLGNKDRLLIAIDDCRKHNISVLPPDINESNHEFTVVGDDIRFGLQAVKGIGEAPVNAIIEARAEGGKFSSLFDFCERVPGRACGKSALETLIKCGALDSIHANRQAMIAAVDGALENGAKAQQDMLSGQMNIFGGERAEVGRPKSSGQLPDVPDADRDVRLTWEKELLGLYISDHPLLPLQDFLERQTIPLERLNEERIAEDRSLNEGASNGLAANERVAEGSRVTCGGLVTTVKKMVDKNGRTWAVFTIEDLTGSIEVLAFAKTYEKCGHCVEEDAKLLVTGRLAADNNRRSGRQASPSDGEEGAEAIAETVVYRIMADEITVIPAEAASSDERQTSAAPRTAPALQRNGEGVNSAANGSTMNGHATTSTAPSAAASPSATYSTNGQSPRNGQNGTGGAGSNGASNGSGQAANNQNGTGYSAQRSANGNGQSGNGQSGNASSSNGQSGAMQKEVPTVGRSFEPPQWAGNCLHLHIAEAHANAETLSRLWNVCRSHPGDTEVWLHIDNGVELMQLRVASDYWVDASDDFCHEVAAILGNGCLFTPCA